MPLSGIARIRWHDGPLPDRAPLASMKQGVAADMSCALAWSGTVSCASWRGMQRKTLLALKGAMSSAAQPICPRSSRTGTINILSCPTPSTVSRFNRMYSSLTLSRSAIDTCHLHTSDTAAQEEVGPLRAQPGKIISDKSWTVLSTPCAVGHARRTAAQ